MPGGSDRRSRCGSAATQREINATTAAASTHRSHEADVGLPKHTIQPVHKFSWSPCTSENKQDSHEKSPHVSPTAHIQPSTNISQSYQRQAGSSPHTPATSNPLRNNLWGNQNQRGHGTVHRQRDIHWIQLPLQAAGRGEMNATLNPATVAKIYRQTFEILQSLPHGPSKETYSTVVYTYSPSSRQYRTEAASLQR